MIEETPAGNFSGQSARDAQPQQQMARPTAQYSAADLRDAGVSQAFENAGAPEREVAASSAYAQAQVSEQSPVAATSVGQSSFGSSQAGNQAASDDALLDLGDLETPQALTEADDFFLDLLDDAPAQAKANAPSFAAYSEPPAGSAAAVSTAEELDATARTDYEEETAEAAPPAQGFAEGELLGDEPRRESASVEEAAPLVAEGQFIDSAFSSERPEAASEMQMAPTERLPENFQVEETTAATAEMSDAQSGAAASASPVAGQITLEQLSPEVIDAIARRAVEHLSARVVEQVAWEVVPDLAEILIRRRLEENKQ